MYITSLDYVFDIEKLITECNNLVNSVGLHKHHNQISLKHTAINYNKDLWYEGCGSLKYSFGEDFIDTNGKLVEQEHKLSQSDFTIVNASLDNTYLKEVIDIVSKDYIIGRVRLMALPHKKCMSIHTDTTQRIHIPIVTNENCLMIINNIVHHMPANGGAYLTDTRKPHTAINANHSFMRLHILFDLV